MDETRCPQCEKPVSNSTCRLVQDTCGHKKCRICLLKDEESCYQCKPKENVQTSVITKNREAVTTVAHADSSKILCDDEALIKTAVDSSSSGRKGASDIVKTVKKTDVNAKKRNYQTIVIPSHITTLRDPVSYKCNVCNKVFLTKSHVKYHIYCKGGKLYHHLIGKLSILTYVFKAANHTIVIFVIRNLSANPI